tara:strand:+ start:1590 stop:1841 length:252 start_codon:yes stop_codon:yes gene_type:complete
MSEANQKTPLKDIVIDSQNTAISVMAGMLEIAQSRGTFNIEESSKLWECIKQFRTPAETQAPVDTPAITETSSNNIELQVKDA